MDPTVEAVVEVVEVVEALDGVEVDEEAETTTAAVAGPPVTHVEERPLHQGSPTDP